MTDTPHPDKPRHDEWIGHRLLRTRVSDHHFTSTFATFTPSEANSKDIKTLAVRRSSRQPSVSGTVDDGDALVFLNARAYEDLGKQLKTWTNNLEIRVSYDKKTKRVTDFSWEPVKHCGEPVLK